MSHKSLSELLDLADGGRLHGNDLLRLQQHVESTAQVTIRVVRQRCVRVAAPTRLRLRILQSLPHRRERIDA